tara:strand:- start:479 stop:1462 length:984 start_codon:yes stop_codon:yes gene_type:complete
MILNKLKSNLFLYIRSIVQLIYGISTFIPGVYNLKIKTKNLNSNIKQTARYSYSVYLRHMVMAKKNNLTAFPKIVIEIGPGDSLGIGLMALLLGSEKYYAFDIEKNTNSLMNIKILEELVSMLINREDIPNESEFPLISPKLDSYKFPNQIYDKKYLERYLIDEKINKIRNSIINNSEIIEFKAPWYNDKNIELEKADIIISQAVLEHFDELELGYGIMKKWLNKDGYMSHSIDFKSHNKSKTWDGHWKIPNWYWYLLKGGRPFLINRQPLSIHVNFLKKNDFNIIFTQLSKSVPTYERRKLNNNFKTMSDQDRHTSGAFIQVIKKN